MINKIKIIINQKEIKVNVLFENKIVKRYRKLI